MTAETLPDVTCPALIIHSKCDDAASPKGAQEILDRLGSKDKKIIWLEKSNHIITLDYDKDLINKSVSDFLKG